MIIRACAENDSAPLSEIYNDYILNTAVTFEEVPITPAEMAQRVATYSQLYPWLVCEVEGQIVGYAYATKWKERSAYKHTCEITVYVRNGFARRGYGQALYQSLLQELTALHCHAVLACITLPNVASISLHERVGFVKVAHFTEVGFKFGEWRDVGYWQKKLGVPT
jgi:L-amino acid N-acyltransferase YncA